MEKEELCQTKIKKAVKDKLDDLEFVKRKETYSETIDTLTSFYEAHKTTFQKWWNKKQKKK